MTTVKTYLTEAYAIDNKSILRVLTQDKQINKADPKYSYYEKLANWANSNGRQQRLKNIELDKINLSDRELITKGKLANRLTTLGHTLNALKNLMDQEGNYNPNSELSKLIQQTTLEILAGLSGIKDPKKSDPKPEPVPEPEPEPEPNPEPKAGAGKDWTAIRARRLDNAKNTSESTSEVLNKFYDDYYSQEYAGVETPEKDAKGIVAKLKSLDKILIPEFNKLGYNPDVNPFAQFLKILIEKKFNIFTKLTTNNYGAIHNSFIEKHVTGNMLGNYNEGNILFCDDLYNKNGLDIVEYLSLQKQALDRADNNDKYSSSKNQLIAVLCIQQKPLRDSYKENIDALLETKNAEKVMLPAVKDAKVKSLLEIQELYRHLFGTAPKTKAKIDEIVIKAAKSGIVLSMVQRLLDQDDLERVYNPDVRELTTWLRELGYTRNNNENKIEKAKDILSEYNLDTATKRSLVIKLQNYYNKNVRDKKAGN